MEYALGFNGHFQLKRWTPLTVIFENRGRLLNGTLEAIVTSGSEYRRDVHQTTYTTDVELPYNSRKKARFAIRIDSFTHKLILRFKRSGETIISRSINLRPYYTDKPLVVVVGEKTAPDLISVMPKYLFPVTTRPRFLPETWYAYDGVRAIVMSVDILNGLSTKQFQALSDWIKNGGYLITASGTNYGALLEKRLSRLLPLKIEGHRQFLELNAMASFCGQTFTSPKPFLVLETTPDNHTNGSQILAAENHVPVVLRQNIGIGKIVFVSFDFFSPPFSRWSHRTAFWDRLLSIDHFQDKNAVKLDDQTVQRAMLSKMPMQFPDFLRILIFVVSYLVSIGIFYHKLIRTKENRLTYGRYLAAVIAVFTAAGYVLFFYPNSKKNLTYNSVAHIAAVGRDPIASIRQIVGIYSIKSSTYDMSLGNTPMPVSHLLRDNQNRKIPNSYVYYDRSTGQHVRGRSDRWSSDFFVVASKLASPGIAEAGKDSDGIIVRMENRSSFPIRNCRGYIDGYTFTVGDIPPNAVRTKRVLQSDLKNFEATHRREHGPPGRLMTEMWKAVHARYQSKRSTLCLVGWIPAGWIDIELAQPDAVGAGMSIIQWEVPVESKTASVGE